MTKFVIVGTQRTGSSMLATTLNLHSEINCGWEWVYKTFPLLKISIAHSGLSGDFSALPEPHRSVMQRGCESTVVGFRLLFSSSPKWIIWPGLSFANYWERLSGFLKYFAKKPDVKIIHVVRIDDMEWLASLYMAKMARCYIGKKYPDDLKVTIPLRKAIKRVRAKREIERNLSRLAETNDYVEVFYEQMIAERDIMFRRIINFLEVRRTDEVPKTPTRKQQHRGVSEVVTNYQSLQKALLRLGER